MVGGGLAGLSAAIALVDAGASVALFEARPRLGGATWSFERNGLMFDNGQHVHLRCCSAYRRFLERLGTAHLAPLDRLELPVVAPGRGGGGPATAWIRRSRLPAPLHLLPSLLAYRHLPFPARLAALRALGALRRVHLRDPLLDAETFASFLARHGQRPRAVEALFDLVTLPTTNLHAGEVSLALAAKVFKTGLLEEADAADLGWARVPLSALHAQPAAALLERAGARVRRRAKVAALDWRPGERAVDGVVVDGERCRADAVILAVPHDAAARLLGPLVGARGADPAQLGASPILDVHLVYGRRVTHHRVAAGVDSPVQFVFDRSEAAGLPPGEGQCLAVSVSGAAREVGERPERLIERYRGALEELFPLARGAPLLDAVVSRERAATFAGVPGSARLRWPTTTPASNLFLAGAWTDTGWPATMEGAVRSGTAAAAAALAVLGRTRALPARAEGVVA